MNSCMHVPMHLDAKYMNACNESVCVCAFGCLCVCARLHLHMPLFAVAYVRVRARRMPVCLQRPWPAATMHILGLLGPSRVTKHDWICHKEQQTLREVQATCRIRKLGKDNLNTLASASQKRSRAKMRNILRQVCKNNTTWIVL